MRGMKSDVATTEFHARFVGEYLKDLNGTAAVRRANGTLKNPGTHAQRLLALPEIQAAILQANTERAARVRVEADTVLRELLAVATCDTNEIVEIRRGCCRHCHGVEHRYQYHDEKELNRARLDWDVRDESLVSEFEHGGVGFDPKLSPDGDCTHCGGVGGAYVHVHDTRNLSMAARSLFAGAKQTKDGIEVKLHSKQAFIEMLGRHLGLFKDTLELKGDLGERILQARKRVRGT